MKPVNIGLSNQLVGMGDAYGPKIEQPRASYSLADTLPGIGLSALLNPVPFIIGGVVLWYVLKGKK